MGKFTIQPHGRLQEWIADEKGYFRDEGLDYEFLHGLAARSKKQVDGSGAVAEVISGAGLEAVRVWSFNAAAVPAWWWNGRLLKRRSPPQEQVALYNRLVPILRPLDRLARLFCGISLIAVARRPTRQG